MRKNGKQMTVELRKQLKKITGSADDAETIITVELMLFGVYDLLPEGNAKDAWSIIPGYNEPILPKPNREMIDRLRILFPYIRNKQEWHELIAEYKEISLDYRLFAISDEDKVSKNVPKVATDREEIYRNILSKPIPYHERERTFAASGEFRYTQSIHGEILTYESKSEIPVLDRSEFKLLPEYRRKREFIGNFPTDWEPVAKEMDQILGGDRFQRFVQETELTAMNAVKPFSYKGNIHIAGGLGVGKSTFILMETYRLVKQYHAKVGIIEGSVEGVLDRVKILRKLGIKAVPVIGKSNRDKHLTEYLHSIKNKIYDLSDLQETDYMEIGYLSGKCVIQALANDFESDGNYPCTSLLQGNRKKRLWCPLYTRCGVIRPEIELIDADVWVATAPSLLKSRFSPMVDPYHRTYFEAMYHLLDVVFIDEADRVQMEFDQAFIGEYDLIGGENQLYERLMRIATEKIANNAENYSNTLVSNWVLHLNYLSIMVNKIYHLLSRSPSLSKNLRHNIFHVYRILHDLSRKIWGENYDNTAGYRLLQEFVKSPMDHPDITPIVDQMVKPDNERNKKSLLEQCMKLLTGEEKGYVEHVELYQELEFFLYLARVDHHFRYLTYNYLYVSQYLGLDGEIEPMFRTTPRDYHPFIKDSMTGILLGYRYIIPDGARLGYFKLLEYYGVGRELLKDWHQIYRHALGLEGPAIVFLSGTSYAPGSHHFHLDIPVHWLMKTKREKSKIEQLYLPIFDFEENQFIKVSGIQDPEERKIAIQKMVHQLKGKFLEELDYWKGKRRVLLVVNSYKDLESVETGFRSDPDWEGKYRILTRKFDDSEALIPKKFIEDFSREKEQILAVPLTAVGRGYNILDHETGKSLFGSAFFLIRPYTVPGDMNYIIQSLHGYLPKFLDDIEKEGYQFEKGILQLRHKSIQYLQHMVKKPGYWKILSDEDREILSWYTLILVWQMIGRLLRGGTKARVIYVDSKFAPNQASGSDMEKTSMIYSWRKIMKTHADDPIFQALYGPFIESIEKISLEVPADV